MTARTIAAAVAAAIIILAGCAGDPEDAGQARTLPTTTTRPPASTAPAAPADLDEALLDVTDLPTGFTEDPEAAEDDDEPTGCKALDAVKQLDVPEREKASAAWAKGSFGPFVAEDLVRTSPEQATAAMGAFADAIGSCRTFTQTGKDGMTLELELTALSFPKLGDDTFAVRTTGEADGITIEADLVLIRSGGVLVGISNGGLSVDTALTEEVARAALAKLQGTG